MADLKPFEKTVLAAFFAGSDDRLGALRAQASVALVLQRRHTGVGEYIDFSVPMDLPVVSPANMIFGDVNLKVVGVPYGVASLLYVEEGRLSFLEFATYTGEWPQSPDLVGVGYFREEPIQPNGFALIPLETRDPQTLARALAGTNPERLPNPAFQRTASPPLN